MPGVQKGKKHKPGAGRPRSCERPTQPVTVWLWPEQIEWLDQTVGGRATVRGLVHWAMLQDGAAPGIDLPDS
jgi:hypothetical protein